MRKLINLGADPNTMGFFEMEPLLHYLVNLYGRERTLKGHAVLEAARVLLEGGANPDKAGCNNMTALQFARILKATELEKLLLEFGGDPKGNKVI